MRKFLTKTLGKLHSLNEEQLRILLTNIADENDKIKAALDSMFDGIIVCDKKHIPLFFNKSAERMLGGRIHLGGDNPLWEKIYDYDLIEFFKKNLLAEETVIAQEFNLQQKGKIRLVAITISPLLFGNSISGSIIHIEDISEKRVKEVLFRRAENLASLTNLAAGIAHEIKNPLASISIHIQLVEKALGSFYDANIAPNVKDNMKRHLEVIEEEISRLNRIAIDFLVAVKPMSIQLQQVHIENILGSIIDLIKPELEKSGINLDLDIEKDMPSILLDADQIKQAILNILRNAIESMSSGGIILITACVRDNLVVIDIEDSGTGISEDKISRIFEPYFTTKSAGTGLGLTIAFKIIAEHKGEIKVTSKVGKGSVFTIELPFLQKKRHLLPWNNYKLLEKDLTK